MDDGTDANNATTGATDGVVSAGVDDSNNEAYESAFADSDLSKEVGEQQPWLSEQHSEPEDAGQAEPEAEDSTEEQPEAEDAGGITSGDRSVLRRAGMDESDLKGMSPEAQRKFIDHQKKIQSDADREFQRKRQRDLKQEPETETDEEPGKPDSGVDDGLHDEDVVDDWAPDEAEQSLLNDIEDELGPAGVKLARHVMGKLAAQAQPADPAVAPETFELAIGYAQMDLSGEYPDIRSPEGRDEVMERFSVEWKTGEHFGTEDAPATPIEAVRSAMEAAARHVFGTTSTRAAQANIAKTNEDRVRRQPPTGSSRGKDPSGDIYAEAWSANPLV